MHKKYFIYRQTFLLKLEKGYNFFKKGSFSTRKWQHLQKKNRKERNQYVFIVNCQNRKIASNYE